MLRALLGLPPDEEKVTEPVAPTFELDGWQFDPGAPAEWSPPTPEHQFSELVPKLHQYLDANTPGIPGTEGAEQWPELAFDALTVGMLNPAIIPGNHRRTSLLVHNLGPGIVYVVPAGAVDTAKGMPIPVNAEREIRTSQQIRLLCEVGDGADVRVMEESS